MERKIIQISTDSAEPGGIVALCDDGTVWFYRWDRDWIFIDPIPQGPAEN